MWTDPSQDDFRSETFRYRAYPIDGQGMIEGPAVGLVAASDDDAFREAHARLGFQHVEVWLGTRRLIEQAHVR